jgi:hypothetical protein
VAKFVAEDCKKFLPAWTFLLKKVLLRSCRRRVRENCADAAVRTQSGKAYFFGSEVRCAHGAPF